MKLIIEIEGAPEELDAIAHHFSDGGGEQHMIPYKYEEQGRWLVFDYKKCFPAWGYDPKVHGPDLVITGKLSEEKEV